MHDIPVDSLSDSSMDRLFKSESMRVGLARGGPHIRFKEASWRDGSGPVWDTDFWGGGASGSFAPSESKANCAAPAASGSGAVSSAGGDGAGGCASPDSGSSSGTD